MMERGFTKVGLRRDLLRDKVTGVGRRLTVEPGDQLRSYCNNPAEKSNH